MHYFATLFFLIPLRRSDRSSLLTLYPSAPILKRGSHPTGVRSRTFLPRFRFPRSRKSAERPVWKLQDLRI